MNEHISFEEYQSRFHRAMQPYAHQTIHLANGPDIFSLGPDDAPRLSLLSGVHGNERSGPLALLKWVEEGGLQPILSAKKAVWILPLLNDLGWNANKRYRNGLDLNRSFKKPTPAFIKPVVQDLAKRVPTIFVDLHEDETTTYPYVFRYMDGDHELSDELQEHLGIEDEPWYDDENWNGTSEVYVRSLGCAKCATVETPPDWAIEERVAIHLKAVQWCANEICRKP